MSALSSSSWNVGRASARCVACHVELLPNTSCWAALCDGFPVPRSVETKPVENKPKDAKVAAPSPFVRLDFCEACWAQGKRPEQLPAESLSLETPAGMPSPRLTMFSFWKTTVPIPQQKKKLLVDDSVLLDLFHRMQEKSEPQEIRFRFVLALILMRKRLLKYEATEPSKKPEAGSQKPEGQETPPPETWRMIPKILAPASAAENIPAAATTWGEPVGVVNPHLTAEQITEVSQQLSAILAEEI